MQKTALIVAGGAGRRMGVTTPKQFLLLGGKPVLVHTVSRFLAFAPKLKVVLVIPHDQLSHWEEMAGDYFSAHDSTRIRVCAGGDSRTQSVSNGLEMLIAGTVNPSETLVAIHDGVRPLVTFAMLTDAFQTATLHEASVACVPVKASLRKRLDDQRSRAVDRSQYLEVQTPQTFRLDRIVSCYRNRPHDAFTDDASLYESLEGPVAVCNGDYGNIKITTPSDLYVAEEILSRSA